jgi:hypothetical protein
LVSPGTADADPPSFNDDYERFARPHQEVQKRDLELDDQLVYRERQMTQLTDFG